LGEPHLQRPGPINEKVANKLADLHNLLRDSGYAGHDLEVFLIRLVYCLFADDTGIFPKDHFLVFIEDRTNENGTDTGTLLNFLFNEVLNRPPEDRQAALDADLQQFDYVNGNLFAQQIRTPVFNRTMRETLLEACRQDWSKVSPAIFGALFQHVMSDQERREIGAHYTSEKNIQKVVSGLFLDDLKREFERMRASIPRLQQFRQRLSGLRFLDPACGCGNFLVITYRDCACSSWTFLSSFGSFEDRKSKIYFSMRPHSPLSTWMRFTELK
jgi:type I restriction-modification system DNA methylase subunit